MQQAVTTPNDNIRNTAKVKPKTATTTASCN